MLSRFNFKKKLLPLRNRSFEKIMDEGGLEGSGKGIKPGTSEELQDGIVVGTKKDSTDGTNL